MGLGLYGLVVDVGKGRGVGVLVGAGAGVTVFVGVDPGRGVEIGVLVRLISCTGAGVDVLNACLSSASE